MASQLLDVLSTPNGPVQGSQIGLVKRYTGIPYAKAGRFEAPVPVEPWTDTFKAVDPAPACPQPPDPLEEFFLKEPMLKGMPVSEGCHHLSVTVPADAKQDEKLAVMVWCHGGAFVNGAGDGKIYNPSQIVAENRLIVVNVSSRLGIFGYLGDGSTSRPANLGLLDVLEALRWVKKNIAAYGGNDDPKTITFFGQSAGGSTVADIMASKEATSLFGRAIIQSAPMGITRGRDAMNKALFEEVRSASASLSTEEMVGLSSKVLVKGRSFGNMGGMPFAPQYGFAPLPAEKDLDGVLNACAPHIDILIGYTAEEALMFVGFIPAVDKATRLPLVGNFARKAFSYFATSMLYSKPIAQFRQRHVNAGGKASLYKIVWASKDPKVGAMHACELPLLFGQVDDWAGTSIVKGHTMESVQEDGRKLRKLWADFAKGRQVGAADSMKGIIEIS